RDGVNNDTIKARSLIEFNENGSKFAQDLNTASFNFGDILEIQIIVGFIISITNIPKLGVNFKSISSNDQTLKEFIKITEAGLSLFTPTLIPTTPKLLNTILIKSIKNQIPGIGLSFNTLDKILELSYFNTLSVGIDNYFTLKFIRKDGTVTKRTLGGGGIGGMDVFSSPFSNLFFEYGDKIEIIFTGEEKSSVAITNFPRQGEEYTPVKKKETYEITENGLVLYTPTITTLPNTIILNDINNNIVLDIQFDSSNNEILVNSTGNITDPTGGADYFKFTLYESDGTTIKITDTIAGNISGTSFSNKISNTSFQNDDIITIQTTSSDKIIVTNFPDRNTPQFTVTTQEQSFKIGANGLSPHIPSKIIFNPNIATMSFNGDTKEFSVVSSGASTTGPNSAKFLVKLRDGANNDTIKAKSLISSNENGSEFAQDLNTASFNFGDILEIQIRFGFIISITNIPKLGVNFNSISSNVQTLKEFI
ncbi:MAG: hypothetical protein ACRC7R_08140, partial [Sarcina sp.]